MRTKTLLLTAALGVATAATTMAQVYSVNAVGYVNTTLAAGWNIISNPLNNQTDNTVASLLNAAPFGTTVYKFTSGAYEAANVNDADFGWVSATQTLVPGEGAFVFVPSAATITFVGEVMQGTLANPIPAGWSLKSSQVPQKGLLDADLKFPVVGGETFYTWNAGLQKYDASWVYDADFGWGTTAPTIDVGQGFWANVGTATSWARTFSVNP